MDLKKAKAEYIAGGISYKRLAEKYGVSFSTIRRAAEKEKWTDLKAQAEQKTSITSIHKHFFINTSVIPVPPFGAKLYHKLKRLTNAFNTISNKNNILFFITITCAIK